MKIKSKREEPTKKSKRLNPQQKVIQAHRLAAADFYYSMSPDRTAVIMRLTPNQANSLRKGKAYQAQMENLTLEMNSTLKKDMAKDVELLRARMRELVPKAFERINDQLDDSGLVGLQAAREVFDREGSLPKVSRVQSTIEDKRTMPDASDSLLQEFGQVPKAVN
jgi:hypothetical protein